MAILTALLPLFITEILFPLRKISWKRNINLVDTKQFSSKMDSLGYQLSKEKCPEETIQGYLQFAFISTVEVKFDSSPDKETSKVIK